MLAFLLACASPECKGDWFVDADGDGFGDAPAEVRCADGAAPEGGDCDDADPTVNPGEPESCNQRDDDCDGTIDEDPLLPSPLYADADADGFGNVNDVLVACDPTGTRVSDSTDCDDTNAAVHPDAVEVCNDVDDDCNGPVDDDTADGITWYEDEDSDGYGDTYDYVVMCDEPRDHVAIGGDCDDSRSDTHPGADETCDSRDNDCNGTADENAVDADTWYRDADADSYGTASDSVLACDAPDGFDSSDTDCDDTAATVNPRADELCNDVDDDCNGVVDESPVDGTTWYQDLDGDGYGGEEEVSCAQPEGYLAVGGDCDDDDASVNPGAEDPVGDGVDGDCDGFVTCFNDADNDDYGTSATRDSSDADCRDTYESSVDTDCDDADPTVNPGEYDPPYDGVDQDCSGGSDADVDGDGSDSADFGGGDCDDGDPARHPGVVERCDSRDIDDDCDGLADEADPDLVVRTWYTDADGDGAGDPATATSALCPAAEEVADGTDCDDTDASIYPLADESCTDDTDRNCDGFAGTTDNDGDGSIACEDCDDGDAARPAVGDTSNGLDDDCDGLVDEYVGDLAIASEVEADTFCAAYAGIEGNLVVTAPSLRGFGCLRGVSGDLHLSGVPAEDLEGFGSLADIGGSFLIGGWVTEATPMDINGFVSLDGLERLRSVGADLWVAQNEVTTLDPLGRLAFVGGGLTIYDLPLTELVLSIRRLGGSLWLEDLPDLTLVSAPSLDEFLGSLWLERVGDSGFALDFPHEIPGTLALVELSSVANAGWDLHEGPGALYVQNTDLLDLDGLADLRVVEGDLVLSDNSALSDLSGLDQLEEVGGDLSLLDNRSMEWDGFPSLVRVGGSLRLGGQGPTIASGFEALESIGVTLSIQDVSDLEVIPGFDVLASCPSLEISVASDLTDLGNLERVPFTRDVYLYDLDDLTAARFTAVTALAGSLTVYYGSYLETLELPALTAVEGTVSVTDNVRMTVLDLPSLAYVGGAFALSDNTALATPDCSALATVVGDFSLEDLPLADMSAFPALSEAGGVWLGDLDDLVSLVGFEALTTVAGSFIVEASGSLVSVEGVGGLTTIGGDLRISGNSDLVDLGGLDTLASIGEDLVLESNGSLVGLNGLGALTSIGGDLWVDGNSDLQDLSGLETFTVGGSVWLLDNGFTSLSGLDSLTEIPGTLWIDDNDVLTDITALSSLLSVGGDLGIVNNDFLPTTEADAFADGTPTVGGTVTISGNLE